MKIIRKIKQHWKWAIGYTVVFGTTNGKYFKQYIVHHRIGRKPVMQIEERREALRGQSLDVIIFDEYVLHPPTQGPGKSGGAK